MTGVAKKTNFLQGLKISHQLVLIGLIFSLPVAIPLRFIAQDANVKKNAFLWTGFALALSILLVFLIAQSVSKTLKGMIGQLKEIADGDLTRRLDILGKHEIGEVASGFNAIIEKIQTLVISLARTMSELTLSSDKLMETASQMSSAAEETFTQAGCASHVAEQVSHNIQTVAASAEEISASINEIARNTGEAAKVATSAVNVATSTNDTISKLGESSTEIGNVIKVITSIAEQTNLLALNATIEAARAGEAGKGFAVVANEVKELAKQTAKATEDISRKIETIQTDTKGAIEAIGDISKIIHRVNDFQSTIASSVEEQSAVTNDISRNITAVTKGGTEIAINITSVTQAAKMTSSGATDTQKTANSLTIIAAQLQKMIAQFKY